MSEYTVKGERPYSPIGVMLPEFGALPITMSDTPTEDELFSYLTQVDMAMDEMRGLLAGDDDDLPVLRTTDPIGTVEWQVRGVEGIETPSGSEITHEISTILIDPEINAYERAKTITVVNPDTSSASIQYGYVGTPPGTLRVSVRTDRGVTVTFSADYRFKKPSYDWGVSRKDTLTGQVQYGLDLETLTVEEKTQCEQLYRDFLFTLATYYDSSASR